MALLVQKVKYGAINTEDPITMGYSVVDYGFDAFTLQEYITAYGQVNRVDELLVRVK